MAHHHSPGFLALVNEARPRVRELTIEQYREGVASGERRRLIDVREDHEWQAGHLPGAEHLSKGTIERDVETRVPDKDEPVALYCGGGFRSVLVADNLRKMGYTNVISIDGGFRGWVERGLPVTTEE